jgi:hypothetical protein
MVFTRKVLAFSRVNDDEVVDNIKLQEVKNISSNSARGQTKVLAPESDNSESNLNTKSESAKSFFQIETSEDGYNAGRTYKIQMKNEKDFGPVVDILTQLCETARDKAVAKSKFKQSQDRVSRVFDSDSVQGFFTIMIFMVKKLC